MGHFRPRFWLGMGCGAALSFMLGATVIILFTRWPLPGQAKTRLIPALGADGAAALQRRMTELVVRRAWTHSLTDPGCRLVVAYAGGAVGDMRGWLGDLVFVPQGEGDLGERLQRAVGRAFEEGAGRVLVVGTDCPRLDAGIFAGAEAALLLRKVVLGPAVDGGYYLIGLSDSMPTLFEGISWSTDSVCAATVEAARRLGTEPALLPVLADVDESGDLPDAYAALEAGDSLSIIIPVLDEAAQLHRLLPLLVGVPGVEVIVVDGGSRDDSLAVAAAHGARTILAERGRAAQLNAGAAEAGGEFLLLLHADTIPPPDFLGAIRRTLAGPQMVAGAFRFSLREPFWARWLVEKLVAWRCALWALPYGDQGLFLAHSLFRSLGGYAALPILEDVELVRRLRKLGRVGLTQEAAVTSARRWQRDGVLRTFLRHQCIVLGSALGVSAERLARWR